MRIKSLGGTAAFSLAVTCGALVITLVTKGLILTAEDFRSELLMNVLLVTALAWPISFWGGLQIRELTFAMDRLRELANVDDLTRLLTRRRFLELAEREVWTAGHVLVLDIDLFKRINDTCGHPTGDRVLAAVARALPRAVRQGDLVGRLGGEEFGLLLRDTTDAEAAAIAERIRADIAETRLVEGRVGRVTASIGMAQKPAGELIGPALARADAALYTAKAAGRNRVATATAQDFEGYIEKAFAMQQVAS